MRIISAFILTTLLFSLSPALGQEVDAARSGNAQAAFAAGNQYFNGDGTAVDKEKGLEFYAIAAEAGHVEAMSALGNIYFASGPEQDLEAAERWLTKAAELGGPRQTRDLATLYGATGRADDMVTLLEDAIAGGDGAAAASLGTRYFAGIYVPQDHAAAFRYFQAGADLGDGAAIGGLALFYHLGIVVDEDIDKALELYLQAADLGYKQRLDAIADIYALKGDYANAEKWYLAAGDAGNSDALVIAARALRSGRWGEVDLERSAELMGRASQMGNAAAKTTLGEMYYLGEGVPKDTAEAVSLWTEAAEQDWGPALNLLGRAHENGWTGEKADLDKAVEFYKRAAEADSANALFNLCLVYTQTSLTDNDDALTWCGESAKRGDSASAWQVAIVHLSDGEEEQAAQYAYQSLRGGYEHAFEGTVQFVTPPASGTFTRKVQALLKDEGFYDGAIDGVGGPGTRRAIEAAFQKGVAENGR